MPARIQGGIEYAHDYMQLYKDQAIELLLSLPDVPARESLRNLVEYVVQRKT